MDVFMDLSFQWAFCQEKSKTEHLHICLYSYVFSPGSSTDKATQRVRRIAVTVSVVSVVYVVLEFCNTLIRTQLAVGVIDGVRPPPEFFASMMACQTNHGINIILYCLSGNMAETWGLVNLYQPTSFFFS